MIEHPIKKYAEVLIESCAYVGTGNVLKIQKMLGYCIEKIEKPKPEEDDEEEEEEKDGIEEEKKDDEKEKKDDPNDTFKDAYRSVAVLGIALIATSEEIGNDMALRAMNRLMQYGSKTVKNTVPLALAIMNLSNPSITIQDMISRMAHMEDPELAFRAIISMGLIGGGTNNARISGTLRSLALYYEKDPEHLFLVRIA